MGNKVFEDIASKICDEVINKDEICIRLNQEILKLEKELFPVLEKEALDKVLKIDEFSIELLERVCVLLRR
jgi:hypothetical protein